MLSRSGIRSSRRVTSVWVSGVLSGAAGLPCDIANLLLAGAIRSRRPLVAAAPALLFVQLDRALLVEGLQVIDHLRDHRGKLAHHLPDVLLRQVTLLPKTFTPAERCLEGLHPRLAERELCRCKLGLEGLTVKILPELALPAVGTEAGLMRPLAAAL